MLTIIPTAEPYHPRVPPPRPPGAVPPKLIHWPAPRHYLSLPKTYRKIAAKRVKRGATCWHGANGSHAGSARNTAARRRRLPDRGHLYGKSGLQTGWLGFRRFT